MVISPSTEPWVVTALMLGLSWVAWIGWLGSLFRKKSADDFTTPARRMLIPVFFTIFSFEGYVLSESSILHNLVTGTATIAVCIVICASSAAIYKRLRSSLKKHDQEN